MESLKSFIFSGKMKLCVLLATESELRVSFFIFSIGSFPELKIILMAMCISVLFSYLLNKYISKDSIFLKLKKRIK